MDGVIQRYLDEAEQPQSSMRTVSDEKLMARVREGRAESLGALFDRYQAALFSFFRRLGNDRFLSEDLVQEVFFRILRYRRTYKPGSPFRTWMYQIARNVRADHLRREHRQIGPEPAPLPATLFRDAVQAEQETSLLEQALRQLPEDKREVLVLSRYEHMKYEQIADILNCEVGAVKVRVHRALRELKESYRRLEKQWRRHLQSTDEEM